MAAVLTAKGRDLITSLLSGATPSVPTVIGWGLNPGTITAAVSDIAMFEEAPEARISPITSSHVVVSIVETATPNDTIQFQGTMTCTQSGGETINEVGIYDSVTQPATTTWATCPSSTNGTTGTLTANPGSAFTSGSYVQDSSGEVMQLGTVSGTTVTGIVRGANGSSATASANGDNVTLGCIPGATGSAGDRLYVHADLGSSIPALTDGQSIEFTIQIKVV